MQIYNVPYNFKHEEKVFGGYVSIRQAIYLIFGATMLGIFFVPMINIFIKSFLFLTFTTMFILFAFLKIDETLSSLTRPADPCDENLDPKLEDDCNNENWVN